MKAPIPAHEAERLAALHRYKVLDSDPEQTYDDITKLASHICGAPIAFVSLVDAERQWFKAKLGLTQQQTPRDEAFCAYTVLGPDTFVVEDAAKDERFAVNPLVTGDPHVRFYAGAPLLTAEGHAIGSMCVIDHRPRQFPTDQREALERLARLVIANLELRRASADLAQALEHVKTLSGMLPICSYCKEIRNDSGYWQQIETFVRDNTDAMLSHGICPKCAQEHFPDVQADTSQS